MEEVRDLLLEQSSGQSEMRPLFREPGLEGDEGLVSSSPFLPISPFHAEQVEERNPALKQLSAAAQPCCHRVTD